MRLPAVLALALLASAFGPADRNMVEWSVSETEATCSNRDTPIEIAVFSAGWHCHWRCGFRDGRWEQVWVDHDVRDGAFVDDPRVYAGACWDESVECPTCQVE